ncbi:MAG: hypothetical protein ACREQN_03345 [Candidatus Binataceae bacterium]
MALVKSRMTIAPELLKAVEAYARALCTGDDGAAEAYVDAAALPAHRAALGRSAALRPFTRSEVLARARLGFHYLVKVRFDGAAGTGGNLTLQNRWHAQSDGRWCIVEIDDLGVRSPWTKPDKPPEVNADGRSR